MDNRVNILLVDDEPRNLDALEAILESPDHRFVRAQSADEALLALLHHDYAAIVLDIRMPGVSGLELAGLIKRRRRTQHIPILFLTAHTVEEQDVLQGYGVGAVDYLQKPINPDILRSKIAVFVDLFRKTHALAAANQALAAEVVQRQHAEDQLRRANEELEARVQERTHNLTMTNLALKESEERFRTMADTVPDIIFTHGPAGKCDYLNARFYEYTGLAPGAGQDFGWAHAVHRADIVSLRESWQQRIDAGLAFDMEHRLRSARGEYRWFRSSVRPFFDPRGRIMKWFGASTDIHELKAYQAQLSRHQAHLEEQVAERTSALVLSQRRLAQQERLAVIGTLATGLGHDMSNLLLPVRARLQSLAEGDLNADEAADVAAIREAVGYLQRLASALRLLAVDPDRAEADRRTDLASWWRDVEGLFRAATPRGVRLAGVCASGLAPVGISASRLTQVIFNLVQNAGEAFTGHRPPANGAPGGTITIHAEAIEQREPFRDAVPDDPIAPDVRSALGVVLTVSDDGPGMTPEIAARCFEPYFSTKTRAVSTGLGLPMVRALVEGAGGVVRVRTVVGKGTTFIVGLPAATSAHAATAPILPATRPRVALTLTDPRLAGFTSAIITEVGAAAEAFDSDGTPDADVWVVSGAAAVPERIAAFVGDGAHRRAIVLADGSVFHGRRTDDTDAGDPVIIHRVHTLGRQPTISALRQAMQQSVLALIAVSPSPAPAPALPLSS